jgi:hypothetical protein
MKYYVKVKSLEWHNLLYSIETESEDEAKDLIENGDGDLEYDDYDYTDKFDIVEIKKKNETK